ncbi:hypothetical protein [Halorussus marinus]|uniref:hypothetical protein n=1 Tax=Halorussus marinus TaxID=2505976 RepID=UPI0010921E0A|nr:hypothetical protein [Halorussus marinus]
MSRDELAPQDQNSVFAKLEEAIFGIPKNDLDGHIHELVEELDKDEPESEVEREVVVTNIDALFDKRSELQHREFLWLKRILIGIGFVRV